MDSYLAGVASGILLCVFLLFVYIVMRSSEKEWDTTYYVCDDPECDFECSSNNPGTLMEMANTHQEYYHDDQEYPNGF